MARGSRKSPRARRVSAPLSAGRLRKVPAPPQSALSGEVGVTPEMLVAPAEQVSGPSIRFPGSTDRALPLHDYTGHAGPVAASQHDHRAGGAAHVLASVPDTGQRRASRTGVSAGRTGLRASASEARLWRLGTPAVRTSPVLGVLFLSWHVYGCGTERADWSGAPAGTRGWRDEVPGTSVRGLPHAREIWLMRLFARAESVDGLCACSVTRTG